MKKLSKKLAILLSTAIIPGVALGAPTRVQMQIPLGYDVLVMANKPVSIRAQCYSQAPNTVVRVYGLTESASSTVLLGSNTWYFGPSGGALHDYVPSTPALASKVTGITPLSPEVVNASTRSFLQFSVPHVPGDAVYLPMPTYIAPPPVFPNSQNVGYIIDIPSGKGLTFDPTGGMFGVDTQGCKLSFAVDKSAAWKKIK